jgi:hypothetical protein
MQIQPPGGGLYLCRVYLARVGTVNRVYIVMAAGPRIRPGTGDAAKFFDSFAIDAAGTAGGPAPVAENNHPAAVPPRPRKTPPPATDLPGLVGYWTFDDGEGTAVPDASGGGNEGRLNNAKRVPGVRGAGVCFAGGGDSYLDFGKSPRLNFVGNAPFTLAWWVQTTSRQPAIMLSWRKTGDGSPIIAIGFQDDGTLEVVARQDGNESGPIARIRTTTPINDGEWHHLALVRRPDCTFELYGDGQRQGASPPGLVCGPITTDLRSFAVEFYQPKGLQFHGCIDEFCLFGRALSTEEIAKLAG